MREDKFEKTYLVPFADQKAAEECVQDLMKHYNHPPYTIQVRPTGYSVEYIVIFPAGAMSFLPEDLKKKVEECTFPIQCGYFHPVVYRFMEEQYIDDFLATGTLQISTFNHCRRLEDATRKDGKEGMSKVVGEHNGMRMETQMMTGDDVFLLCTSLASKYIDSNGIARQTALEIIDLGGLVDACTNAILKQGYHVINVLMGPCFYSEKQIYGELLEEETAKMQKGGDDLTLEDIFAIPQRIAGPKMIFQKPLEKAIESEYRMVWRVIPKPQDERMLIQIDHPTRYARKVKLQ